MDGAGQVQSRPCSVFPETVLDSAQETNGKLVLPGNIRRRHRHLCAGRLGCFDSGSNVIH